MPPRDLPTEGLVTVSSAYRIADTVERLKAVLAEKGLHLFAHIDHAAEAEKVGMSLRPTQVVIFGNPHVGTPLMQTTQMIGLDLPLRILVWEDAASKVWLTYTEPRFLARRYGITDRDQEVEAMSAGLAALTHVAGS